MARNDLQYWRKLSSEFINEDELIVSTAYKRIQEIRGEADAKASENHAKTYAQKSEAAEFQEHGKSSARLLMAVLPWCFQPIVSFCIA
ncbi:hypothetical protein [Nitrosomonas sp. Nm34]|uniref:hypothetical protein n=1 Tax=Nitrosomonas sp. Nm34 TaxID=1881055 RepID=UPI0008E905B2|nr:hypothetical protein [Nitrosomonas sp. Nm34]SFI30542.1 hypothetical protein SAMN05428978_100515 [Nitrosomonas sp. Nm34]